MKGGLGFHKVSFTGLVTGTFGGVPTSMGTNIFAVFVCLRILLIPATPTKCFLAYNKGF